MLVVATQEAITATEAAWAGIQLDFAAQLKPRVPDEHFKGMKMKYGFFRRRLGRRYHGTGYGKGYGRMRDAMIGEANARTAHAFWGTWRINA